METVESEKRKANKSMAYFKKQNSEYREINQNQKQVIFQLQGDLSDKDRNIKPKVKNMIKYCSGITITNLESIRNGRAIIKKLLANKKQK